MNLPPSTNELHNPRAIAVVDVGFTNTKVILYDAQLHVLAERKISSPHHEGRHYREIDVAPMLVFATEALRELDAILPIDVIVPCSHGACIVALKSEGTLAVPVMDYMSEPPDNVRNDYQAIMPSFEESLSPLLPMALMHGMQLYWQSCVDPEGFAQVRTILPLMQYIAFGLGGRAVTEVSSMSCQSHLVDMRTGAPSSIATAQGWAQKFAPAANAWDDVGQLSPTRRGLNFQGRGRILAGVHDSNANYLRYLASGRSEFTLLSTGTWIISFDTAADRAAVDLNRDIVANSDVFGRSVFCSRFFGGKEFELIARGVPGESASLAGVAMLVDRCTFARPSFSDSGGPMPNTGGKGHIEGALPETADELSSLASLYCALMTSESLDGLSSRHAIIVDGPFSQNPVFLAVLAALRPNQEVFASAARDGTAAGAACLALMPDGKLPHIEILLQKITPASIPNLPDYQQLWREQS